MAASVGCPINSETFRGTETRAKALYFSSHGQTLFAWLHVPAEGPTLEHGVVICPSIGHEQVHAHRGLRHLAEALAGRGMPALRFDWFATGDSSGGEEIDKNVDLSKHWLANVRDAVSFMRRECSVKHVSIIGFRVGALLAVEGLVDEPIDNLVLWVPVTNGRGFTRELILLGSSQVGTKYSLKGDLEAGGFRYSAETIAGLAAMNLAKRATRSRVALVVSRDDAPADSKTLTWLQSQNVAAELHSLHGVKEMLSEPHATQVPHDAITLISDWLAERIGNALTIDLGTPLPVRQTEANPIVGDSREYVWTAGRKYGLAGVVTEPLVTNRRLPLIVLLNSGAAYRIGVGRLYVMIARRLTELGFRSLRFDLRGIGDSPVAGGRRENDTYPATGFADMAKVLESVCDDFGHDRCVFMGLCSGAYFAFQAASQFSDPALVESILINPLTYYWREGMTIDDPELRERLESHWRFSRKLDVRRLWKFLSGRSRLGYLGAVRELFARLAGTVTRLPVGHVEPASCADSACGHPLADDLPADLLRIAEARRKLTLFVSDTDPGLAILKAQAGRQVKQLMREGVLQVSRIANSDHTFSRSAERDELVSRIASHLAQRYL